MMTFSPSAAVSTCSSASGKPRPPAPCARPGESETASNAAGKTGRRAAAIEQQTCDQEAISAIHVDSAAIPLIRNAHGRCAAITEGSAARLADDAIGGSLLRRAVVSGRDDGGQVEMGPHIKRGPIARSRTGSAPAMHRGLCAPDLDLTAVVTAETNSSWSSGGAIPRRPRGRAAEPAVIAAHRP